jgi:hypothetical protein
MNQELATVEKSVQEHYCRIEQVETGNQKSDCWSGGNY